MKTPELKPKRDGRVRSSELVRCVEISSQLKDNLAVFKRLHGDRWPEVMADMGTALQLRMKATGETNPIAAAIPVAKAMSRDNQNPMLLLAVATDLAQAPNACVSDGPADGNENKSSGEGPFAARNG